MDVAIFSNNYPSIDVSYKIIHNEEVQSCVANVETVQVAIQIQKKVQDEEDDNEFEVDLLPSPLFS